MKNHQKNIPPQTIHGLFEAQVRKTPDAVALVYRDTFVTYEDLNRRANHVARRLRDHGVGKDYLVGLYLDRSIELLVGLLGILKAGGAYVPLDPVYPEERVDFILRDSGLNLVVTCQNLQHQIEGSGVNLVLADEPEYEQNNDTESDLEDVTGAEGLAYVIYTSGSTGQPKGVMVTHRNVVRLFQSTAEWFGFDSEDVWTMFHSYAFDFSVWEMWGALFHGGRLVIVPQEIARSPEEFHRLVEKEKITVLCQIPYVFYQMMKIDEQIAEKSLASLRYIIFGGEALNFQQLRSWYARHDENQPRLINMYGITETTVHVTYRPLSRADTEDSIGSMIGKPIPDLMVYIMDENLKPVPEGEVGELFVGGEGLARGYLDRPDLDRQRFIQNAFSVTEERLYRTGDLVRLLPDGDMEYIGRQDDQVKIRGFRIEPGEVEAVLESYPGIQEAAVVAQEIRQEEKQLVAFFTTKGKNAPEASELRQFLMDRLPLHMVPSRFILLEELPVTPSGKVDRRALKVDPFQVAQVREYTAPRTTVEETLARFWSEMLCVSRVSIHDNFFELGGHSLLVLRFIARVRDAFGINLPLRLIFDQPVLEEIASWIEKADHGVGGVEFQEARDTKAEDWLPLSYPQENIYFIQKLFPACRAYHGRSLIHFRGDLNVKHLELSLAAMIERHEIYRTTFREENGQIYRVIHSAWSPVLERRELRSHPLEERGAALMQLVAADLQVNFDLATLPLVRWFLYRMADDEYTLLFIEHHLVHDGWSFNVFIRDWFEHYRCLSDGTTPVLPALTSQFSDFARAQRDWMNSREAKEQLAFWREILADPPPPLELPADYPRPAVEEYRGSNIRHPLPETLLASLKKFSREESSTLFMTMLAAFYVLLFKYTGHQDLVVGSGAANRNRKEFENVTGMFINTIALRARLNLTSSFREFLQGVRKMTLDAYDHQEIPFDKVVEVTNPRRSLSRNALFQVMFNFNDAPLPVFDLPGMSIRLEEGIDNGSAKFDLNVIVIPRSEQLVGTGDDVSRETVMLWEYSTALFDRSRISRMIEHYLSLLQDIVDHPDRRMSDLLPSLVPQAPDLTREDTPLDSSWKVDRRSLHALETGHGSGDFLSPRNETEKRLITIWKEVLGVEQVGVRDNFFELGGHSLLATRLFGRIEREFSCSLPMLLLFKEGTVEALAAALEGQGPRAGTEICIPVQVKGNKPPFFCVSPSVIDIATYHDLAQALGKGQPFYAVYAPRGPVTTSPEGSDPVAAVLEEVRHVQPSGPYYVGGYSSGGRLAYRLADRLHAQGERVELLVLMDAFAPGYPRYLPWVTPEIYNFLRVIRRIQSYLWKFWILDWKKKRDLLLSGEQPFRSRFRVWVDQRRQELDRPMRGRQVRNPDGEQTEYDDCIDKVLLLRARQGVLGVYRDPTLGWGDLLHTPPEVKVIPGDHESILFGPRTHGVAAILNEYLPPGGSGLHGFGKDP